MTLNIIKNNVLLFRAPSFDALTNVYEINSCNMEIRDEFVISFPVAMGVELAERYVKAANISLVKQIKSGTGYFINAADLGSVEKDMYQYVLFCDNDFYQEYLVTSPLSVRADRFAFSAEATADELQAFISFMNGEIMSYCKAMGLKDALGFICSAKALGVESINGKSLVLVCNDSYYQGYQAQLAEVEEQPLPAAYA